MAIDPPQEAREADLPPSADSLETEQAYNVMEKRLDTSAVFPPQHDGDMDFKFLPASDLYAIIQPESVRRLLQGLPICPTEIVQKVVDYVCGSPGVTTDAKTARRLLAILIFTQQPQQILDFYEEGLCDGDLPFTKEPRPIEERESRTSFVKNSGEEITSFHSWSRSNIDSFDKYQWWVFVPFFAEDTIRYKPPPPLPIYRLYKKAILPWTSWDKEPVTTGHHEVRKIQIHPSQHRFSSVRY